MPSRRNSLLTDFVANQYPVDKYKQLVFISSDIMETFLIAIEGQYNYKAVAVNDYEKRYGQTQRNTSSQIESLMIKDMDTKEKMQDFIKSYFVAYHFLDPEEKEVFYHSFIERLSDSEINEKMNLYTRQVSALKRNAVIKFCIKSGLNKLVYVLD